MRRAVEPACAAGAFCAACASLISIAPAAAQCKLAPLAPPQVNGGAAFGWSIAAWGDQYSPGGAWAIVGAYYAPGIAAGTGAAYVFRQAGIAWQFDAQLIAQDGGLGDYFGVAVAIDGARALVGADGHETDSVGGAVYVFTRGKTGWTQTAKITPDPLPLVAGFGHSIALDGDRALIGAFVNDHGKLAGAAFVYSFDGDAWVNEAQLHSPDFPDAKLGWSVALDGERALVGAVMNAKPPAQPETPAGTDGQNGMAFIFERSTDGSWPQIAALSPAMLDETDFGAAVALQGNLAAVGAPREDSLTAHQAGAVHLFQHDGDGNWQPLQSLLASDGASHDYFGVSVVLEGDDLAIGAYARNGQPPEGGETPADSGAAYLFHREDGLLQQSAILQDPAGLAEHRLGWSAAIAGDAILVGAVQAAAPFPLSGSVMSFARPGIDCNANGEPDFCDIASGLSADVDLDGRPDECAICPADIAPTGKGDGQVNIDDLFAVIAAWGPCAAECPLTCAEDIDQDCDIDIDDLFAVIAGWGPCQ